jgi:hypothetical protein
VVNQEVIGSERCRIGDGPHGPDREWWCSYRMFRKVGGQGASAWTTGLYGVRRCEGKKEGMVGAISCVMYEAGGDMANNVISNVDTVKTCQGKAMLVGKGGTLVVRA